MKRLLILVFMLVCVNAYAQFAVGIEGGATLNFFEDRVEVTQPTYGVQIQLFDLITASYSTLNTISLGVMPFEGNKSSRGLARTCRNYNSGGFSWGLEASYSIEQNRGGVGVMFGYKVGKSNILTLKANTIDGIRFGYMFRI